MKYFSVTLIAILFFFRRKIKWKQLLLISPQLLLK